MFWLGFIVGAAAGAGIVAAAAVVLVGWLFAKAITGFKI